MKTKTIPLSKRKGDLVIVGFYWLNLLFITYQVDLEQLVIKDPSNFKYPAWPLPKIVDLIHWWGRTFDPVLLARPTWWKATIWIDNLFFGPYYACAIYAFTKGKNWIRIPSIIYASVMMTNVTIILSEETFGEHHTQKKGVVYFANAPWLLMPIYIMYRMWRKPAPFSE